MDKNYYLPDEKPLIEFPGIMLILVVLMSIGFALAVIFLPPIFVFLIFIAVVIGIAIIVNPFVAIPIFIIGGYLHPVAFVSGIARFHPTTIFAAGVLFALLFHIVIYRDFKPVKGKQTVTMFLFFIAITISCFYHWEYSSPALIDFIKIIVLYFIVIYLVDSKSRVTVLISILIPLGIIVALYAFYLAAAGVGRGHIEGAMRIISFEGNPNYLALSLVMLIPILFGLSTSQSSKIAKTFYIFIIGLFSVVVLLTYSRSGFLGLVVALSLSAIKFFTRRNIIIIALLFLSLIMLFVLIAPPQIYYRLETIFDLKEASIVGRLDVYRIAFMLTMKNPLVGVGMGVYSFQIEYFNIAITRPDITNKVMEWAHNVFLEIGSKAGAVALLFFILSLYYAMRDVKMSQKIFIRTNDNYLLNISRGVEISILSYLVFAMFATSLTLKLFWVLLGLTYSLHSIARASLGEKNDE